MSSKWCSGACGELLPHSHFARDKSKKDGLSSRCRACAKAATKAWTQANPKRAAAAKRRAYERGKKHVVYRLTHVPTGQYYVGSTHQPTSREQSHRYALRTATHWNPGVLAIIAREGYHADDWTFEVVAVGSSAEEVRRLETQVIQDLEHDSLVLNRMAGGGPMARAH